MSQAAQARTRQAEVPVNPAPRFQLVPAPLREAIRPGSVLLKHGTVLPPSVDVNVRPAGEWNLVVDDDATAMGRRVAQAGWNFFFIVPAIDSSALALDPQRALVKALNDMERQVEGRGFNAVEVVKVQTRRLLGVWIANITAHPRHVRRSPFITDPDPYHYPAGVWDFNRIFAVRNRRMPQMKAM